MSLNECTAVGLPPNPFFETEFFGETFGDDENYDGLIQFVDSAEDKDRLRAMKKKAQQFDSKFSAWEESFLPFIELPKSKLYVALREGKVFAYGKSIGTEIERDNFPLTNYAEFAHSLVTPGEWRLDSIDWNDSLLNSEGNYFIHIGVDTNSLFENFPPGELAPVTGVFALGDQYVFEGQLPAHYENRSRRGRPALPWEEFHVEVAKMIAENRLPAKKEAAIALMQEWFLLAKQQSVSRSAIGQKLKFYYDRFGSK